MDEKTYVLYNLYKNKNITITFNKNRISGKITVNKYNASFSINDQNVEVNNISKTKMIGPKELMNIENEYLDLLSNAETIKIRGNFLTIKTKDNKELIFKEKVDLSVNYLNGKEFTLKNAFNNLNITICFTKKYIYGYNNSKRYLSSYTINDDKILIDNLKLIKDNEANTSYKEDEYINLFTSVYKINLENDKLILTTKDKKERLIYKMEF